MAVNGNDGLATDVGFALSLVELRRGWGIEGFKIVSLNRQGVVTVFLSFTFFDHSCPLPIDHFFFFFFSYIYNSIVGNGEFEPKMSHLVNIKKC